jgi:hypothetical protein
VRRSDLVISRGCAGGPPPSCFSGSAMTIPDSLGPIGIADKTALPGRRAAHKFTQEN